MNINADTRRRQGIANNLSEDGAYGQGLRQRARRTNKNGAGSERPPGMRQVEICLHHGGVACAVGVCNDALHGADVGRVGAIRVDQKAVGVHGHCGVAALEEATGALVYIPQDDDSLAGTDSGKGGVWGFPPVPEFTAAPMPMGNTIFGDMVCQVLKTPGHTPGGVSLYFPDEHAVFSGDALFYRSIGRTDFPGGDHDTLLRSLKDVLFKLPADTLVYPGHGPTTNIGDEIANNPFCGEFRP